MISRHFIGLLRPFARRIILAVFCLVMVALFQGLFAIIIQPLMDEIFHQSLNNGEAIQQINPIVAHIRVFFQNLFYGAEKNMVVLLPLLLFFTFFGQSLFTFLSHYLMKTLGLKVIRNIRKDLYANLIHQSVDFLSRAKTGDLVSRLSNDIDKIRLAVSETLSAYIREAVTLVVLLIVIFYWDWKMALFSLILLPVSGVLLYTFGKKVKKRGLQSQETIGELSGFLSETVVGNKIVKAYNMETYEIKKFSRLNRYHYRINSKIAMVYSLAAPIMHTIGGLVAAIIFAVGMTRVSSGHLSPGQFTSFLASLFLMYNPIKRLSGANNQFNQGIASYERIMEIISKDRRKEERGKKLVDLEGVRGKVEFRDLRFSYEPGQPVLDGINLVVEPNQMVAIVGPSGAGKSTLINLLLKFYLPGPGMVQVDGRDIREIRDSSLRDSIGLVTQEVVLFNDTIEKNISYGSGYSREQIIQAARNARIYDHITSLPRGLKTVVGERGVFLSAGQRQRIAIARAIIKNPSILIFDEATSSLDAESEKYIQMAMQGIMKGRTSFVIAHRLSTIIRADRIIVLKNGRIVETGRHDELLKQKGLYYSLYNLQFP